MRYFILHKPYGYLSQFTRETEGHKVLSDLFDFPKDVYPVGRLDKDSEGLLILTNDNRLNYRLLQPDFEHKRTYIVQVEGIPNKEALIQLEKGVTIKIKKKIHHCKPVGVTLLVDEPTLEVRNPPVRFRKNIPTSFLELTLTEGKNRQVRRMCAAIGFPVLRLVRVSIEGLKIGGLPLSKVLEISQKEIYGLLKIKR